MQNGPFETIADTAAPARRSALGPVDPGLANLRQGEFGQPWELLARFAVIFTASMTLYFYNEQQQGLYWALAYFLSQGLAWCLLNQRPPHGLRAKVLGYGSYLLTTFIFVTLPLWLLVQEDTAMAYCGAMGLMAGAVFTLWREEPPPVLLPFDVAIGCIAVAFGCYAALDGQESMIQIGIMIVLSITTAGYYSMALITTRAARVSLKKAAVRGLEAQKMEAIGRLSGGIAHDFNNILTVLQGNFELYEEIPSEGERRVLVREAHEASVRASSLVAQLLAFARRAPLAPTRLEAGSVIADLARMAERVLPTSIRVTHVAPHTYDYVEADPDRLLSALLNLVINARDALEGRGDLILSASIAEIEGGEFDQLDRGRHLRFEVIDNGPGMSPELSARALQPFYTTKPVGAGSGLGLPMAKGFAEQSGGGIANRLGAGGHDCGHCAAGGERGGCG